MKKIEKKMQEVLGRGEKILVSGVPIGYPDVDSTRRIVEIYLNSGVDVVEFSMPSINPFIDTNIIANSNLRALTREPNIDKYFDVLYKVREDFPDEPFYMMAYADIIRKYGIERFVNTIQQIGIDSVELPDKEETVPDLVTQLETALEKAKSIERISCIIHSIRNTLTGSKIRLMAFCSCNRLQIRWEKGKKLFKRTNS